MHLLIGVPEREESVRRKRNQKGGTRVRQCSESRRQSTFQGHLEGAEEFGWVGGMAFVCEVEHVIGM